MKTGILTRDVEHYNPRCNARGTIKAGTEVFWTDRGKVWAVRYLRDASFMLPWDFAHSYVNVPADAVQEKP